LVTDSFAVTFLGGEKKVPEVLVPGSDQNIPDAV
jgi:hypothetical protein